MLCWAFHFLNMKLIDLSNRKYGMLTVISLASNKPVKWNCQCDCGSPVKTVIASNLKHTYSCGCNTKALIGIKNTKHGQRQTVATKTYKTWASMIHRTRNDNPCYGGRGIKVSVEWQSFENFFNDIGEIPEGYSIERINVNGDYCKENCTLIPLALQAKNRTTTLLILKDQQWVSLLDYCTQQKLNIRKIYDKYRTTLRYKKVNKNQAISLTLGFETEIKNQKEV